MIPITINVGISVNDYQTGLLAEECSNVIWQELELACGRHFGVNEGLTMSRDTGGATPGLAVASQSASGLSRFTISTHSPSAESPFHSCVSKVSSPSAMGVSGLSRVNSPSLARINAQRYIMCTSQTHAYTH